MELVLVTETDAPVFFFFFFFKLSQRACVILSEIVQVSVGCVLGRLSARD